MRYLITILALLAPFAPVFAQVPPRDFNGLVNVVLDIIDMLVVTIFAITLVVFIWGIMKAWILNAGDESEIEKGKNLALWGVIVLVIMSGIWGLLYMLRYSLFGGI